MPYHLSFRATSGSKRTGGVAVVSPAPSLTTCSAPLARRGQPDGFSAGSEALDSTPSSLRLRLLALVVSPPLKGEAEMGFAPKSATPISRPVTQASWAAAPTASGPEPSSAGGCSPRIWRSLSGGDSSLPPFFLHCVGWLVGWLVWRSSYAVRSTRVRMRSKWSLPVIHPFGQSSSEPIGTNAQD